MEFHNRFRERIRSQGTVYASYVMTLYYFEVVHVMFSLLFLFGKAVSVTAGLILAILLTVHIVRFYYRIPAHRVIQLVIADLHAAVSAAYLISLALRDPSWNLLLVATVIIRIFLTIADIAMIFLLTDRAVAASFNRKARLSPRRTHPGTSGP